MTTMKPTAAIESTAAPGAAEPVSRRRTAIHKHTTRETDITVTLDLDGSGQADIQTGIGFLDHLLTALVRHSGMDCTLACRGDLHVDDHHTAEDCALALGRAMDQALGARR